MNKQREPSTRTDWFQRVRWGVSSHDLADFASNTAAIDMATGKEVRVAAADIDEVTVSPLSPMASNMLDQIGEKNLPDLLAYLMQPAAKP
ncbi:MAG: hypothetical protein ACKOWG_15370 [Planctomycetia bacterium]